MTRIEPLTRFKPEIGPAVHGTDVPFTGTKMRVGSSHHIRSPRRHVGTAILHLVPLALDRQRRVQHRHLDAECGCGVADGLHWRPSPLLVALVQTATNLPVFLLGVPAGAIADIVDRRKLLIITQGWMLAAAAAAGRPDAYRRHRPVDAAVVDLRARPRRDHERSRLARHHAGSGSEFRTARGDRAQLGGLQSGARHRPGAGRRGGRRRRRRRRIHSQRYFLRRRDDRAVPVAARSPSTHPSRPKASARPSGPACVTFASPLLCTPC